MVISKYGNNRVTNPRTNVDYDMNRYLGSPNLEIPMHGGDAHHSPWTETDDKPIPRPRTTYMDNACIDLPYGTRSAMILNRQHISISSPIQNQVKKTL